MKEYYYIYFEHISSKDILSQLPKEPDYIQYLRRHQISYIQNKPNTKYDKYQIRQIPTKRLLIYRNTISYCMWVSSYLPLLFIGNGMCYTQRPDKLELGNIICEKTVISVIDNYFSFFLFEKARMFGSPG